MGRKEKKKSLGLGVDSSGRSMRANKMSKQQPKSEQQIPFIRKQIDPETTKYFSDIANLFESNEADLEERSVICGNALEETNGKEYEIATDYILSHTLQTLLEGCDVDQLCNFLHSCAEVFPAIAVDRSGSHVAETALKSLARHLQDEETYSAIQETLNKICKAIAVNPIDMMCNCYGSHVLRRLLCLCKGVSLDSPEFHGAKSSAVLAGRLNLKASRFDWNQSQHRHQEFPDLFNLLLSGISEGSLQDMKSLQVDQFSSLVFQTSLKLLVGQDDELLRIIPAILGCRKNMAEEIHIEADVVCHIVDSMKETSFSHLMEVILDVAPASLFNQMFNKVFKNSLFKLSLDRCGNFVIQALVSHVKDKEQLELIWKELGTRFKDLLEQGKPGVIASVVAASQRLHSHEHKCCEALSAAVGSENESQNSIVPRLLFLDNYFTSGDKSNWIWASGAKMHVMGSLILQEVFKFPSEFIQPYITSMTALEADHIFEAAKDGSGARVLEAFLGSDVSAKQKRRLVMRLRGHFGELALHSSGSFTVDKCFDVSNLSLREAIASELSAVRNELSKTKQGPYLLRKLDIDGFAAKPDIWRSRQESKQSAYKDFVDAFDSKSNAPKKDSFLSDVTKSVSSQAKDLKNMREEISHHLTTGKKMPSKNKNFGSETVGNSGNLKRPFLSGDSAGKKKQSKKLRI